MSDPFNSIEDCGINDRADLPFGEPLTPANPAAPKPRVCRRHDWTRYGTLELGPSGLSLSDLGSSRCARCGKVKDETVSRRSRNNRKRGNAEELTVARKLGGRKMGPLGLPWDVELPGYARLQVRKYATPQGLRTIADEIRRIGYAAPEMPGYVWVEPGRGGARLIVFDLDQYATRHGFTPETVVEDVS